MAPAERDAATIGPGTVESSVRAVPLELPMLYPTLYTLPSELTGDFDICDQNTRSSSGQLFMHT